MSEGTGVRSHVVISIEIKDFEEQLQELTGQITTVLTKELVKLKGRERTEVT